MSFRFHLLFAACHEACVFPVGPCQEGGPFQCSNINVKGVCRILISPGRIMTTMRTASGVGDV